MMSSDNAKEILFLISKAAELPPTYFGKSLCTLPWLVNRQLNQQPYFLTFTRTDGSYQMGKSTHLSCIHFPLLHSSHQYIELISSHNWMHSKSCKGREKLRNANGIQWIVDSKLPCVSRSASYSEAILCRQLYDSYVWLLDHFSIMPEFLNPCSIVIGVPNMIPATKWEHIVVGNKFRTIWERFTSCCTYLFGKYLCYSLSISHFAVFRL